MNSAFRAIWLVPQSRDIKYYSPPGGFRVKKMSRETHFIRKWSNFLGIAIKLVFYILKQLFASVSVTSGGYLPRRSGSVNIHRYSPPLLRIIVKYKTHISFRAPAMLFCGTHHVSQYIANSSASCCTSDRLPQFTQGKATDNSDGCSRIAGSHASALTGRCRSLGISRRNKARQKRSGVPSPKVSTLLAHFQYEKKGPK